MKLGARPGLSAEELLDLWKDRRLNFYDEFNMPVLDTDLWTAGGDAGGGATLGVDASAPTHLRVFTNNVIDEEYYVIGNGFKNKAFSVDEVGYGTVTWTARMRLSGTATLSAFFGLLLTAITAYAEPAAACVHFLADPAVSATFRARSFAAAEEETDTLIAIDAAYHDFKIVWTAASILFYIDNVLVATHATQVPRYLMISEFLMRSEANSVRQMYLDSLKVELS